MTMRTTPGADEIKAEPLTITASSVSAEILVLYQHARAADAASDFKPWALARAARLVPLASANWVSGVMTPQGPLSHEAFCVNMGHDYWPAFSETLKADDPIGTRMFANLGASFVLSPTDFPPASAAVLKAWDIESAVIGMVADRSTGTFSAVAWHRGADMAPFDETERVLHEQLLPHWVEGLHLYRVGVALRDLDATALPGHLATLVESTGIIHFAQAGFGELLAEEFADWAGAVLPLRLTQALAEPYARWEGLHLTATRRTTWSGLWLVHLARRRGTSPAQAREFALSTLTSTLSEKEQALALATMELDEQRRRRAVQDERERIMRELHDGVGAHLVGLRSLLRPGKPVNDEMSDALDSALDEMRLAVDSMQAVEGDLGHLLATLRWRMQPRLEAAGIEVHWSMPDPDVIADACAGFGVGAARHVQRMLLEAFTNILKHARATEVTVHFECRPDAATGWRLLVRDNGVGLPPAAATGQEARPGVGLASMARRAAAIGALLRVDCVPCEPSNPLRPGSPGAGPPGTELSLVWPAPNAA